MRATAQHPCPVVLVPHPPLLLRELCGASDAVPALRQACAASLTWLLSHRPGVVVVAAAAADGPVRSWLAADRLDVRRLGSSAPRGGGTLPLALGVGLRLLDEAGWRGPVEPRTLAPDPEGLDALADRIVGREDRPALLLLGEGSARRGVSAPGYLDERAFAFDDALCDALAAGESELLAGLDVALAEDLMVSGATVLRLMGRLGRRGPGGRPAGHDLAHREDPHGVSYLVARWSLREPPG